MTENDDDTKVGVISFGEFLTFLQVIMQFAFDQTKEREKCFGFTIKLISYSSIFASNFR